LGESRVRCIDIRHYSPPPKLAVEFIIGGPPCQTFSAAGRRASGVSGIDDPRGTLFAEYVRLLSKLKPRGFLFENVYGITGAQGGKGWEEIQIAFRQAGYTLYWRVLDAADYGVPQHRERLFIVGVRGNALSYRFPYPTHGPDSAASRPYYTAAQAVHGAEPENSAGLTINGRWGHLIAGIPPGLNYSFYTEKMGHPNPVFAWRSKFSDFMYKADPDAPVRTIKAQGGLYTGPFSWEDRHFSIAEMKRLQTFPDNYEIVGARQTQLHQIGNSVPPQIGRILAISILHQFFGLPFPIRYLDENQVLGFRTRKRELTEIYSRKAQQAIQQLTLGGNENTKQALPCHEIGYLSKTFALLETPQHTALAVKLDYISTENALAIDCCVAAESDEITVFSYTVHIQPSRTQSWAIPLSQATLSAQGHSVQVFTALWKAFERRIAKQYGIDDLVQLSGYYQYPPKLQASLSLCTGQEPVPLLWCALTKVVAGIGVSSQIEGAVLADLWGIPLLKLLPILRLLRSIGYEVRNHNTNSQIPVGEYLIPYIFPTLTPRSVQLRKSL